MNGMMATLAGLNEGLRVRHIAAFPLLTCYLSDPLQAVLARPDLGGIDQIPIVDEGRIVALWEHSTAWRHRSLDDSLLVSADAPLWDFIHTVHQQPYRLVVDKTNIAGIVTWSDLLKVPVFVLAFSVLAELEVAMNDRIQGQYHSDSWVELLDPESRQKVRGRQRSRIKANIALPAIEAADLSHKAQVLHGILGVGRNFDADLEKVSKLRNDVDHVKELVRTNADLRVFVEHLETAEAWLEIVKATDRNSSGS